MNCSTCQPLLSAYIDATMSGDERAALDSHLRQCAACRSLAEDLRAIRRAASSLEPLVPSARVWQQIAAAAEAQPRGGWLRSGWLTWRPLTAVAMAAVIATGLWRVGTLLGPAAPPRTITAVNSAAPAAVALDAEADFTLAIARLEEVASVERSVLDQDTAGALNAGLVVIDEAINESRAALQSEPQSETAQESLFVALRRKVALLQEMLALINEMREGDQDGAARILSEINR
jgi:anti-sigma factor RsiW